MARRSQIKTSVLAAFSAAIVILASSPVLFSQSASDISGLRNKVVVGTSEEKRQALYDLRVIGTEDAARAAIPALTDGDEVVRATAVGVVAKLSPDEAARVLVPLLSDKESFVRKEACLAIGSARATAAREKVLRVLEKDEKPDVRASAATALGIIGEQSDVYLLVKAIEKRGGSKNAYLRREAAFAIGRIAERSLGEPVSATFPENFLPLKYKTRTEPGRDRYDVSKAILLRLLGSEKEPGEVRRAAAYALGATRTYSTRPEIERCAVSEDPYLAETCRESLAKLQK